MKLYSWLTAFLSATYGPEQVDQFLQGLLIGLVNSDDLDKIQACVKDTTALSSDL